MEQENNRADFESTGFSLAIPESYGELKGLIMPMIDAGETDFGSGILMAMAVYLAVSEEDIKAMEEQFGEEPDEEKKMKLAMELLSKGAPLFFVTGFNEKKSLEDAMRAINPAGTNSYSAPVKLGSCDGFEYYLAIPEEVSEENQKRIDGMKEEQREELFRLRAELLKHPEWFTLKPRKMEEITCTLPGTAVSFDLEDLDGNTTNSAEVCAQARITIASVWAATCPFCIEEFPDLDEIHRTYRGHGVQVITVCNDAEGDLTAKAAELTKPYSFRTFAKSESFDQALMYEGTPTAYFLDENGIVMTWPVIGKRPQILRERLDALLAGDGMEPMKEEAGKKAVYTVKVTDQNGSPVPGVKLSFCSDNTCNTAITDENGGALFAGEAFPWHLQILSVPEGYVTSEEERIMKTESEEVTLTVQKA